MTMANTFAAKLSVAFVAIAMALSMVAPAQAATAEEMQAQIDALMAQLAALTSTPAASTASGCYTFTRSLTIGSQGADVTALQNALIKGGYSVPAGATGYFGSQTAAAVAAWQTANAVSPAAGYFGPVSQAKFAATCDSSDDSDDSTDDSDDSDSSSSDLSGEASVDDSEVDLKEGEDTDIEEGQEAAPVADFEIAFADGDAKITRLDVSVEASGSEEDAWDTFEEISLWVDGEEVATMDASDEDNYQSDEKTLRFTGLDLVAMEDETITVTIGASVQGSVDNMPATWNVDVTSIRFVDGDDVTSTEDITVATTDFEINVEGADDELIIKTSSEDPESATLIVEDDTTSDMMSVFVFDMDSDDSTNDLELNNVIVGVQTGTADADDVINDAVLVIDGEEFDDWSYGDSTGTEVTLNFDIDGDYAIEAGERVAAELQIEFKKLDGVNYAEGETITATTTATGWDVEGADDVTPTGSASGETHTIRTGGLDVAYVSDATSKTFTADDAGEKDRIEYEIVFEVTALEDDVYLDRTVTRDNTVAGGSAGDGFMWATSSDSTTGTTSTSAIVSAEDTDSSDTATKFYVAEGETREFTLTVTLEAGIDGAAGVILTAINWTTDSTDATPNEFHTTGLEDYKTDTKSLNVI